MSGSSGIVESLERELAIWLGRMIGATEMMRDAASDGKVVEIECCKRVFDSKNHGCEADVAKTAEWDRRIVFGDDITRPVEAKL